MLIQFLDEENGIIEIGNAISFSQTRTHYRVTYWAYPGNLRFWSIKKAIVKEIWINGRQYEVVLS